METSSKSTRRRRNSRDIEAAEDHHHPHDAIQGEGAPNTNAYTHEDCHHGEGDNETAEDEHKLETDDILDYAIEYRMRGGYPPGLTKDKKRAVRKRAQAISVEDGEVYIQRKKNKVCLTISVLVFTINQIKYTVKYNVIL